ncbi:MAG TPA: PAS domain-containing sensor histidine kinase [Thermoanaerobaculia bacterium]|nr:PAS domain-containing sensor histidine kinase [Thermoanaerobaculia bacterium]
MSKASEKEDPSIPPAPASSLPEGGGPARSDDRPRPPMASRAIEIGLSDEEINARRYEAIVESSDDAIISKALDGTIMSWNPAAERLFGYTADEMIGKPISVLMPEERHDDMESILGRIRRGERIEHYETVRVSKTGRKIPVSLSVSPVRDASGRIVGAAKIARDISGRRRAEAERERLLRDAQQGVQIRDVFLSVAGHELRTPLNALRLLLYNLARSVESPAHRATVERAEAQVERLTELTGRLLDVARMAAGGYTLEPKTMDLCPVVENAVARIQEQAARANSSITVSSEPIVGFWDPSAIDQVVTNLLSNAIKFGGGKPIEVAVRRKGEAARVAVRDQGPGVSEPDRQRILERFERGVSEHSYGGLGLGLWIARQIVAAHGGRIGVEEAPGAGAVFYFELPLGERGGDAGPAG